MQNGSGHGSVCNKQIEIKILRYNIKICSNALACTHAVSSLQGVLHELIGHVSLKIKTLLLNAKGHLTLSGTQTTGIYFHISLLITSIPLVSAYWKIYLVFF